MALGQRSAAGWQTYPDLISGSGVVLVDGEITPTHAEDMLPLALSSWVNGQVVNVENAEPVYLRNEVTWKNFLAARISRCCNLKD